jgi:hypothetical protein
MLASKENPERRKIWALVINLTSGMERFGAMDAGLQATNALFWSISPNLSSELALLKHGSAGSARARQRRCNPG